jgi:hypothetical protein
MAGIGSCLIAWVSLAQSPKSDHRRFIHRMDRSSCSVRYAHEKNQMARGLTCAQRTLPLLNLIRRYCNCERNPQCLKMTLAAADFISLISA